MLGAGVYIFKVFIIPNLHHKNNIFELIQGTILVSTYFFIFKCFSYGIVTKINKTNIMCSYILLTPIHFGSTGCHVCHQIIYVT